MSDSTPFETGTCNVPGCGRTSTVSHFGERVDPTLRELCEFHFGVRVAMSTAEPFSWKAIQVADDQGGFVVRGDARTLPGAVTEIDQLRQGAAALRQELSQLRGEQIVFQEALRAVETRPDGAFHCPNCQQHLSIEQTLCECGWVREA